MRFEWLFLRWLVIIALGFLAVGYALSWHGKNESSQYKKVLLIDGKKSLGGQLAGIAVDPAQREVFGLFGRGANNEANEFFILWKGSDGRDFGVTVSRDGSRPGGVCEILPDGETRMLHEFQPPGVASSSKVIETPEQSLRSILSAVPRGPELAGKP